MEVREILIRRKGLWIILLSLTLYGLAMLNADRVSVDPYYNEWKTNDFILALEGPLDETKEERILQKQADYERAAAGLEAEKQNYRAGGQSKEEYETNAAGYIHCLKESQLVRIVREQYSYVREDPENRYFINMNGWNWFFESRSLHVICVTAILLLTIPIFMTETESKTHDLMRSCSRGCGSLYRIRVGAGVFVAVLYTCAGILLELWIAEMAYGLGALYFPLTSLSLYQYCPDGMKIGELLVRAILCRVMGTVCFAVLCMVLSVLLKNTLRTFIAGALVYFAPYFMMAEIDLYRYPLPLPLFETSVYIRGYQQEETGRMVLIGDSEVARIYAAGLVISVLLVLLGFGVYHEKIRPPKGKWKKTRILMCAVFCALWLDGCTEVSFPESYTVNPSVYSYLTDGENYAVITSEMPYLLYDKETGTAEELIADPLFREEEYEHIFPMFFVEDQLYYLRRNGEYESIWKMDCRTRGTTLFCELRRREPKGIGLWGIGKEASKRSYDMYMDYLEQCQTFYLWADQIFVLTGRGIQAFDQNGQAGELVIADMIDQPAYRNGLFYYRNLYGFLVRYNCASGETVTVSDVLTEEFCLGEEELYFTDMTGELYEISLADGTRTWIQSGVEHLLAVTDSGLCYRKKADDGVYIFTNGKEVRVADDLKVVQMAEVDGGILYIAGDENGKMMWGTMFRNGRK